MIEAFLWDKLELNSLNKEDLNTELHIAMCPYTLRDIIIDCIDFINSKNSEEAQATIERNALDKKQLH